MGKKAKRTVAAGVYLVEGFDVTVVGDDPDGGQYVDDYPFTRAASSGWTVKMNRPGSDGDSVVWVSHATLG